MGDSFQKLTLSSIASYVRTHSIEDAYRLFKYDYAAEANRTNDDARRQFIELVAWNSTPTTELVRRFFNQINTAYAEKWLLERPNSPPKEILLEANRFTLYRQAKSVGFRKKSIGFGYRVDLPFGDVRRQYKWLYGIEPELIEQAIYQWSRVVDQSKHELSTVIALTMALIAIHPFSDANGRVARLVFTWLCRRWRLKDLWLDEAADGELLRTGHEMHSTEYLMAVFMLELMNWHNKIEPPDEKPSDLAKVQMFDAFCTALTDIASGRLMILDSGRFRELKEHLDLERHFRGSSPRFNCLRGAIA